MDNFEKQLNQFMEEIKKQVPNKKQKQVATLAGAKVWADSLSHEAKQKHYSNHKDKVYGHMADNVKVSGKNIDGMVDGSATVGWDKIIHAMNALYTNDGTVKMRGDHWVDEARKSFNPEVFKAEIAALKEMEK